MTLAIIVIGGLLSAVSYILEDRLSKISDGLKELTKAVKDHKNV